MTVIASDGIHIAADGLTVSGDEPMQYDAQKIFVRHGRIYAISGAGAMAESLIAWHAAGADPKDVPPTFPGGSGWGMLVISGWPDTVYEFFQSECPYPSRCPAVFTIGSGCDYALGAMKAGASAHRAVEIAAECSVRVGGRLQVVNIAEALGAGLAQAAE
jgi:ATP-dependent protease HslVU (ClpYQ) peptidase subunit